MSPGNASSVPGRQIAAGRVLAGLDHAAVAAEAGVSVERLRKIEANLDGPSDPATLAAVRDALTRLGVQFLPEGRWGLGVRLKFNRQQTRQIEGWENEGGAAADDEIP